VLLIQESRYRDCSFQKISFLADTSLRLTIKCKASRLGFRFFISNQNKVMKEITKLTSEFYYRHKDQRTTPKETEPCTILILSFCGLSRLWYYLATLIDIQGQHQCSRTMIATTQITSRFIAILDRLRLQMSANIIDVLSLIHYRRRTRLKVVTMV